MRKKELRAVVSFRTTTQALEMEEAGKEAGLLGRLIPIPLQLTADCGLAWSEPIQNKERLLELLEERQLACEAVTELVI